MPLNKGESNHYFPQFLPGGKEAAKAGIYWGSLDGRKILPTPYNGLYDANSGRLLYVQR